MTNGLRWIGRMAARRRGTIVLAWIVLALGLVALARGTGGATVDTLTVPGVESQRAADLLDARFPERSGATATVVFHDDRARLDTPTQAAALTATVNRLRSLDHVLTVSDPLATPGGLSADRHTGRALVQYDRSAADLGPTALTDLTATGEPADAAGVQVEYGGEVPSALQGESTGAAEAIGVIAALIILLIAFRSLTAMALPLLSAAFGLATGLALIGLLAGLIDIPTVAPRLGTMIGLGVGIDYALFVLSRHRDNLAAGMGVEDSLAQTNATAGKAVVIAGTTVIIAILGLQFAGIPFVAALGYATALVVALAVAVAITLLPALLAYAGRRVLPHTRAAANGAPPPPREGGWMRWAATVSRHPWRATIAASAVLLIGAIPLVDMQLGQADAGSEATSTTQRRAYDLLAAGFGPGSNGPLLLTLDMRGADGAATATRVREAAGADPNVSAVGEPPWNDTNDTALLSVIPTSSPQERTTSDLVHRLRRHTLPAAIGADDAVALVGGPTASFIDQSDRIAARLPWFIGGVIVLSFLLLMTVFRSLLVPLTAAVMNLLSIGAAYGVVVAVFQWGWGISLVGLDEPVPIASFVPMMMFAILFGLSMDYEVFILSRIREEHRAGRDHHDSVIAGLGATAKVVTAAALIMVSVFIGFVFSSDPIVKMMGVGLATAVAVDATIVRMILLPATMALTGKATWWFPRRLNRVLPRVEVDG